MNYQNKVLAHEHKLAQNSKALLSNYRSSRDLGVYCKDQGLSMIATTMKA